MRFRIYRKRAQQPAASSRLLVYAITWTCCGGCGGLAGAGGVGDGMDRYGYRSDAPPERALIEAAKEPSLQAGCAREAYRVSWLVTGGPDSTTRVEQQGDRARVERRFVHQSSTEPGTPLELLSSAHAELTHHEWLTFKRLLATAGFWQAPTADPRRGRGRGKAICVIEACDGDRYRRIERQEPQAELLDVCLAALQLGNAPDPR